VRYYDLLKVVVNRGYYLGIAFAQVSHSYEHTPVGRNTRLFWEFSSSARWSEQALTAVDPF